MPSVAEIAYRESVRALEGEAQDLENIRSHVSLALSAGGVSAAFLGALNHQRGYAFWLAVLAFAVIAIATVVVYWPVSFPWDFDGYQLVATYVDANPPATDDFVMRELALHAAADYQENRATLNRLFTFQSVALAAFGLEVGALLLNLALG
jgi:hypothetical protein